MADLGWYSLDPNSTDSQKHPNCTRCHYPFKMPKPYGKQWFEGREVVKRPLCAFCDKRDRALLVTVMDCLRMFGGMITIYEILDLYNDTERIDKLHFDPFAKVRQTYTGDDALTIDDLEGWVEDGILEMSKDKHLSPKASKVRDEIERQHEKRMAQMKQQEEYQAAHQRSQLPSQDDSLLSRLNDSGGASTGRHRWEAMRTKKI